ncbi:MAG: outer membrane beta-barrel protein, partial [Prolixibacteraceae bacterium]|jgi:hypothetical protein|nr:outer membrane beta-barrel protein [Prolixibacteraceae bacterium]
MKKYYFVLFILFALGANAQSKFYVAAESGMGKNIIMSTYGNQFQFNPREIQVGLKGGYNLTNNIAIETGFSRLSATLNNSFFISDYSLDKSLIGASSIFDKGLYAIPLHVKLSTNVFNDKWSVFTYMGASYLFAKTKNYLNEYDSNQNSNNNRQTELENYNNWVLDAGIGLEYSVNSKLSVYSQFSFSLGQNSKPNTAFDEIKLMETQNKPTSIYRWKGDRFGVDLGVKYRF